MTVRVTNNFARVVADVERAAQKSVRAGTLMLGKMIRETLSRPGKGRVYVRRKNARKEVRRIGATGARFLTRGEAARLLRERRTRGLKNRSTRSLGFHKASAPGDPPAVDTGNLRNSWQTGFSSPGPVIKDGNKYRLVVGSKAKYARRLEFGGGAIAPRPYVRPTAAKFRPMFSAIVAANIQAALAKYRGTP